MTDSDLSYDLPHPCDGQAPADTMVTGGFVNNPMLSKHLDVTLSGIPIDCPYRCDMPLPSICFKTFSVTYHVARTVRH